MRWSKPIVEETVWPIAALSFSTMAEYTLAQCFRKISSPESGGHSFSIPSFFCTKPCR